LLLLAGAAAQTVDRDWDGAARHRGQGGNRRCISLRIAAADRPTGLSTPVAGLAQLHI
jgi:hypothetical protein